MRFLLFLCSKTIQFGHIIVNNRDAYAEYWKIISLDKNMRVRLD